MNSQTPYKSGGTSETTQGRKNSSTGLFQKISKRFTVKKFLKTPLRSAKRSGVFFVLPFLTGCGAEDHQYTIVYFSLGFSFLISAGSLFVLYSLLKHQIKKNPPNHYLFTENPYTKPSCVLCDQNDEEDGEVSEDVTANAPDSIRKTQRSTSQRVNKKRKTVIDVASTKPK